MTFKTAAAVAALLVSVSAGAAQAATINVDLTLDLTQVCYACGAYVNPELGSAPAGAFSPAFEVDVAEGDTLNITLDFLGQQQLTATNIDSAFLSIWTKNFDQSDGITSTGNLSFLDSNGASVFTTPTVTDTDGSIHAGQYLFGSDFGALPSSISFSGLRWSGTVDDYGFYATRTYAVPNFYINAENVELSIAQGVPEPTTWALLIGGFGLTGAALRRRRVLATA